MCDILCLVRGGGYLATMDIGVFYVDTWIQLMAYSLETKNTGLTNKKKHVQQL